MEKSEQMLMVAEATKVCSIFIQCPGVEGVQILCLGVHSKISKKNRIVKKMTFAQSKHWMKYHLPLRFFGTNI